MLTIGFILYSQLRGVAIWTAMEGMQKGEGELFPEHKIIMYYFHTHSILFTLVEILILIL